MSVRLVFLSPTGDRVARFQSNFNLSGVSRYARARARRHGTGAMKPSVVQNQNKNRRGSKYGGVRMKIAGTPHSSILIVDDDPLVSELVATQCRLAGMSVQRAPNGLRALVAARQNRPTLLITSLRLPHLDGLSLCERLLGRDAP